jgi:hypothetical protein
VLGSRSSALKRFWALSAWKVCARDDSACSPKDETKFVRWTVRGSELPSRARPRCNGCATPRCLHLS